jgi:hypothetical protein
VSLRRLGALSLSIIETVAVFAGIPAAVILVVLGIVYAGGARSGSRRYRPGRPYDFAPVWFLAAPDRVGEAPGSSGNGRAVTGANRLALSKSDQAAAGSGAAGDGDAAGGADAAGGGGPHEATGGASDRW